MENPEIKILNFELPYEQTKDLTKVPDLEQNQVHLQ